MSCKDLCFLVYVSTLTKDYDIKSFDELIQSFKENNKKHDITGYIICKWRDIIQVIEGPCDQVETLWMKIKSDNRHKNTMVLMREKTEKRIFGGWPMKGEHICNNQFHAERYQDFDIGTFYSNITTEQRVANLLEKFRTSHVEIINLAHQSMPSKTQLQFQ